MSAVVSLAVLGAPLLLGLLTVSLLMPRGEWRVAPPLPVALGLGLGAAVTSTTATLWHMTLAPPGAIYFTVEVGVIVLLYLLWHRRFAAPAVPRERGSSASVPILRNTFSGVAVLVVVWFTLRLVHHQHGAWDAWAIWNLRARFLYRAGDNWMLGFSEPLQWSHPDYPLLLPGAISRAWHWLQADPTWIPAVIAGSFTLGCVMLVVGGVARFRGRAQGYLAGLALLATIFFVKHGASQFADTVVSFYILATIVVLMLYDSGPRRELLILAGLFAGSAAWTKNEGLLFVASIVLIRGVLVIRNRGGRGLVAELVPILAGVLPFLVVIGFFKVRVAPPNDIFNAGSLGLLLHNMADPGRVLFIVAQLVMHIVTFSYGIILFVLAYTLGLKSCWDPLHHRGVGTGTAVLVMMLVGYVFAYIATPHNLEWHIQTSMDRLLVQLWPAAILLVFVFLPPPRAARAALAAADGSGVN